MATVICNDKNWLTRPGNECCNRQLTKSGQAKYENPRNPLYIHKIHGLNIEIHEYSESPAVPPPNFHILEGTAKKIFGANAPTSSPQTSDQVSANAVIQLVYTSFWCFMGAWLNKPSLRT